MEENRRRSLENLPDWLEWADEGLAADFYPTHEEAAFAARKLGIKTQPEYTKLYKQDPLLPLHPDRTYRSNGWTSWSYFLTGQIKSSYYLTLQEATEAARKLGAKTREHYKKNLQKRQSSRLQSRYVLQKSRLDIVPFFSHW